MKTQKCMCLKERKYRLAKKNVCLKKFVSGHSYMKVYVLATHKWSQTGPSEPSSNQIQMEQ